MNDVLITSARTIWRSVLPERARRILNRPANMLVRRSVLQNLQEDASPRPGPLIVSGFLSEGFGIGRAGRMTVAGLRAAGYAPREECLRSVLNSGARIPAARHAPGGGTPSGGVWILHCNPSEAIAAASRMPRAAWEHRYRIGYWAYEFPNGPQEWRRMARFFHEIWTPSQFVADAFQGVGRPIRVMPHFHAPQAPRASMRDALGLGDGVFVVGAAGDLKSSGARKNLDGVIAIYKAAFETPQDDVRLLVKVSSAAFDPMTRARLEMLVAGRSDIRIIDEYFSDEEMAGYVASLDVFLSPHRSEGYGLTISEAFLSEVAALATGWSGNIDYMAGLDEALIGYRLVPAKDPTRV